MNITEGSVVYYAIDTMHEQGPFSVTRVYQEGGKKIVEMSRRGDSSIYSADVSMVTAVDEQGHYF